MRALNRIKFISFSISFALITVMLWISGGLRVHAENLVSYSKSPAPLAAPPSRFDELLSEIKDVVKQSSSKTKSAPEKGFDNIEKLTALRESLEQEHEKSQDYFDSIESAIKKKELPNEILKRHQEFAAQYESKYETLMEHLDSIESANTQTRGFWARLFGAKKKADWDGIIGKTLAFLEKNAPSSPQSHFDPKNMPHRSLKADKTIAPKLTNKEWAMAFPKESVGVAPAPASKSSPISLAATAQTTPADLEETIEVKFTPEIRQLADSLDKNPVKIFNWVRNNIEFVPTWGSIQGAQLCLENKAGNAFDTSSLLIALLRYSGIPARYQMGTIEAPIEKFMNWAGGFTNADAAASLFASAGVPSVVRRVNQGGQVVTVRLEHVWVKAFVDYAPSAAAVPLQSDMWVEIDPSFKQYQFSPPVDLSTFSSLGDPNQLLGEVFPPNSISPEGSEVVDMNQTLLEQRMTPNSDGGLAFLQNTFPNLTMRQVAGGLAIISKAYSVLGASLPYRTLARAPEFASIPDSLRHRLTIELLTSENTTSLSYSRFLPEVGASHLVLGYDAASAADSQYLANLLPTDDAAPFPRSWPAFAIKVKPIFKADGAVVAEGPAVGFLSQQRYRIRFSAPTIQTADVFNDILAGETQVIALDLQRPAPSLFQSIRERLNAQSNRLAEGDWRQISFTDLGELTMGAIAASWFAEVDMTTDMASNRFGVVTHRYPSAAVVFADWRVSTLFGGPISGTTVGFAMDIDHDIVVSNSRDGNPEQSARLNLLAGMFGSQMEAVAPAQYMWSESDPSRWINANSVVTLALANGVTVALLDSGNIDNLRPKLSLPPDTLRDIEDAVAAGRKVLVHEQTMRDGAGPIVGYVAFDPETGSGAYIIQGGTGGSQVLEDIRANNPAFEKMLTMVFGFAWDKAKEAAIQRATEYVLSKLGLGSSFVDLVEKVKSFKGALDILVAFVQDVQNRTDFYNKELAKHGPSVRPLAGLLILVGAIDLVSKSVNDPVLSKSLQAYANIVSQVALKGYEATMTSLASVESRLLDAGGLDPATLEPIIR